MPDTLVVNVDPAHVDLRPGESADVTVSVLAAEQTGGVAFPVRGLGGKNGSATLTVGTVEAVVFGHPKKDPERLPVTIELLQEGATSAIYRITATEPGKVGRKDRKRLGD